MPEIATATSRPYHPGTAVTRCNRASSAPPGRCGVESRG